MMSSPEVQDYTNALHIIHLLQSLFQGNCYFLPFACVHRELKEVTPPAVC